MKIITSSTNTVLFRFDKDEEVIKGLMAFSDKTKVQAGHFTGLGACASTTLSYYDTTSKKYLDKTFEEDLEILSLTGNVAKLKKETVIHVHGVFADSKYKTIGGHVKEIIVSATCEVHLTILKGMMERGHDEKTGLNLLK